MSYSERIWGLLIREIFRVLNKINPIDRTKGKFQISLSEKLALFFNEINKDIKKNKALIGNAVGKKNTPIRKNLFPCSISINSFTALFN